MNNNPEEYYNFNNRGRIAFMRKISTTFTHELNNIFSIIYELAGSIEDQLHASINGIDVDSEEFFLFIQKIYKQIDRGTKLSKELNKFLHSADNEVVTFELNSIIKTMIELIQPLVRSKDMTISFDAEPETIPITAKLINLEHIFFIAINLMFDFSKPKTCLLVSIKMNREQKYYINITGTILSESVHDNTSKISIEEIFENLDGINVNQEAKNLIVSIEIK